MTVTDTMRLIKELESVSRSAEGAAKYDLTHDLGKFMSMELLPHLQEMVDLLREAYEMKEQDDWDLRVYYPVMSSEWRERYEKLFGDER